MFERIKASVYGFLAQRVLRAEMERLRGAHESYRILTEQARQDKANFEAYKKSLNVGDLVRARLMETDFDAKTLENESRLPESVGSEDNQNAFLAHAASLAKDESLGVIMNDIHRRLILKAAVEEKTLEGVNFVRAQVEGLALFRAELYRLGAIYADRHAAEEEFDRHEVT